MGWLMFGETLGRWPFWAWRWRLPASRWSCENEAMCAKEPTPPEYPPPISPEEAALVERRRLNPPAGEDFWVFAYGSLMWRPGFNFLDRQPALLRGYHRAFCVISHHYRGTAETAGPGAGAGPGRRLPRPGLPRRRQPMPTMSSAICITAR